MSWQVRDSELEGSILVCVASVGCGIILCAEPQNLWKSSGCLCCPPPPRFLRRLTSTAIAAVGALVLAFLVHIGDAGEVAEAQASQTVQVTPTNFSTYFDIDSTTEVATLNSAYDSDHTLVFAAGVYRNAIQINNATNLTIRGANPADSDRAATIQANKIIESARGSGNGAIFAVKTSSNVTIDNLNFDYQCLFDAAPRTALYGLFFQDTSGTISNNVMENYRYVFGRDENGNAIPNPCLGTRGVGIPAVSAASFRAIRIDMTASHVPNIDSFGKVTNLLPIRVTGNKISRVGRSGINVYGYFDAKIDNNVLHDINTAIQITGGADATVSSNRLSNVTVGVIYAPHWYVRNSPDGETINAEIEIRENVFEEVSGGAIQLGFAYATRVDGTTIHTKAKIVGNHILNLRQDNNPAVGNSIGISVYSNHDAEGEQIRADIIGNTFEQRSADSDNDPIGIYASSAYLAPSSTSTWFDLRVHYNEFLGFQERTGVGVWITNIDVYGGVTTTFPVANARVHASNNYWGPQLRLPKDFIQDRIEPPETDRITYKPYLITRDLTGHTGPYGQRDNRDTPQLPVLPGFTVAPASLTVVEGQTGNFDVALDAAPVRDLRVTFTADNSDISFSPSSVTFTSSDWDTPRTVSISAALDRDLESETAVIGALVNDGVYMDGYAPLMDVQIYDAGIQAHHRINRLVPEPSDVTVRAGDSVRLGVVPYGSRDIADNALIDGQADVVWTVEGGGGFREAVASLDSDNAPDDRVILFTAPDSPGTYTIHATLASCGADTAEDCRATFTVNVLPGVTVSPASLTVVEGQTGNFDVALDAAPERDLRVTFTADNSDISFSPSSVTFTSSDWDTPRTVSIGAALDRDLESETAVIGTLLNDGVYMDGYAPLMDVQIYDAGIQAYHRINRLVPEISEVTVRAGDSIRLGVVPYGRQDIADNALIDGTAVVVWTAEGGGFREAVASLDSDNAPDDRVILFTAPDAPGIYTIHATLASCGADTSADCRATFTVNVRRPSAPALEPTVAPTNPVGDIPNILVDADGGQYEVFTPVEGGNFADGAVTLTAGSGAVPNGEIVGLRVDESGAASNAGMTHQRYTLAGDAYTISAVDESGASVSSYRLASAIGFCAPLPDALRSNISDVAMLVRNADGSLTVLATSLRISGDGVRACAKISSVPAAVAVGAAGVPAAIPTPTPEPTPEPPDAGGAAPSSGAWMWLFLLVGVAATSAGLAIAARRRRSFLV